MGLPNKIRFSKKIGYISVHIETPIPDPILFYSFRIRPKNNPDPQPISPTVRVESPGQRTTKYLTLCEKDLEQNGTDKKFYTIIKKRKIYQTAQTCE